MSFQLKSNAQLYKGFFFPEKLISRQNWILTSIRILNNSDVSNKKAYKSL